MDFGTIRERMADYLNAKGVAAVTAWPAEERLRREGAVAAVTLRACQAGPAGGGALCIVLFHEVRSVVL